MKDWLPRLVARAPFTVHTKLNGAFFAIVALLIVFGFVVLQVLGGMNRRSEDLTKLRRKVAAYRQLQHDTIAQLYSVTSALLSPQEQVLESALRQLNEYRYDLERLQFVTKDEADLFKKINAEHERLNQLIVQVLELTRRRDFTKAKELRIRTAPLADSLERLTNEMVNRAEADMEASVDESNRAFLTSRWAVIGFAVGSIGLAVLLGYAVSSSLMGPVTLMNKRLGQIASGDFSASVNVPNRDELGTLANNLNRMNNELRSLYQQIETASRHKSDFLASMSHELRTPLNAIIGYSEMLTEEVEDRDQRDLIPDLQKIRTSGKHLLALINDILDLSKIEAGKTELSPETFDIAGLIEEVVSMVQPLMAKNANVLSINRPDDLGSMFADITKVRQVLFNLLSNACKFTELGTITLDAAREKTEDFEQLSLSVRDTGIGMTDEQIARMFQPFSQADIQTARKYGGTGLGLAITKKFCEIMGGEISVASEFGRGTIFTVKLPLSASNSKADSISLMRTGDPSKSV
ncbi:MAG TPA: ATP-binding protein [Nitrospirota bacterium]|nr:ATP-binding protein [Nitrospirota bacterium]